MIAIVDYGMGNLHSVQKVLRRLGFDSAITADPEAVLAAQRVVLPGVGAFGDAMAALSARGLDRALRAYSDAGRPLLGICLGLQLFFDGSEESEGVPGLGLLRGRVRRLPVPRSAGDLKVPQMGWNRLEARWPAPLLEGLPPAPYVYFVHSYYVEPEDEEVVAASTPYGFDVPAVVGEGSLWGVQFHPEKSGSAGLRLITNFAAAGTREEVRR